MSCGENPQDFLIMSNPNNPINIKNQFYDDYGQYVENKANEDMFNTPTVFEDWLFPSEKEARQDSRQLMMDRASYANKMAGMKEAGINPLTAAAGLAGSSTGAVAQPASSTNPIGDVAGAVASTAAAGKDVAAGVASFTKLGDEVENIQSDTFKNLTQGGLNEWSAKSIEETLPLLTDNMRADYYQKLATIDKTWQEYENLRSQHDNIVEELNLILLNENLVFSEQQVNEARTNLINEQARWQKEDNDFWESAGYRRGDPIDQSIRDVKQNGKDPSFIGQTISDYKGQVKAAEARAQYSAEAEFANQISYARKNGENASDVLYGRIGSSADLAGRIASLGTNLWNSAFDGAKTSIQNLFKSGDAKKLRSELTTVLNNAFDQLDKYPEDRERLTTIIADLQMALQLSNKELLEWSQKNWSN